MPAVPADAVAAPDDGTAGGAPAPEGGSGRCVLRAEVLAALEVCGLAGLAFTRPVLDSFGRSPETFIARHASTRDVVLFALVVALLPSLVVGLSAAATRLAGSRVRRWAQVGIVGVLAAVAAARFGADLAPGRAPLVLGLAVAVGAVLAVARHRVRPMATYLRYLGAASVVFVAQFLVFSPASALVRGGDGPAAADGAADAVAAAGDDPPPIVVVVLDALPTVSLLDGTGHIDSALYPNLGRLADDATWYRNNTTVSSFTYQVVPSLLSGRMPDTTLTLPDTRAFPDNLFTLFSGTHDIEAVEQITRLCPTDACGAPDGSALPSLLGDAVDWWHGGLDAGTGTEEEGGAQFLPGALDPDRAGRFTRWVDRQDFSAGDRPGLWFYHLVLPHEPWDLLPDGTRYDSAGEDPYGLFFSLWGDVGPDVGRQRQVLQTQAVDRMLGDLFDRLREAGTYDDSLIVVAGDHGQALEENAPLRGLAASQYEQVAWTPMIVKAPHQDEGVIDDGNMWNIDLVPTIADMLGIDLPWSADGIPASDLPEGRAADDKAMIDQDVNELEPVDGGDLVVLDAAEGFDRVLAADFVPGEGEMGVWQRGEHGALVGREVAALRVAGDAGGTVEIERLDRIEQQGEEPPMLEVIARVDVPAPAEVVLAVNGEVTAVAPIQTSGFGSPNLHALLLPDPFSAENEVTAYLVEGEPGAETLRPLQVAAA